MVLEKEFVNDSTELIAYYKKFVYWRKLTYLSVFHSTMNSIKEGFISPENKIWFLSYKPRSFGKIIWFNL